MEINNWPSLLNKLKRACLKFGASEAEAEDIAQETALRVLEKKDSFNGDSTVWTFVYRVAFNLYIDRKRRSIREVPLAESDRERHKEQAVEAIERGVNHFIQTSIRAHKEAQTNDHVNEIHGKIHEAVQSLPSDERTVLTYRYYDQKDYDEIGSMIGVSPTLARVRLSRALTKLKRVLNVEGKIRIPDP